MDRRMTSMALVALVMLASTAGAQPAYKIITGAMGATVDTTEVANNALFCSARTPANGGELWKYDTNLYPVHTLLVKDINPGAGGSAPQELVSVGGRLFFRADDGTHGEELWTSD